jgi:chemotaxis signal transduction protein
VIRLVRFRTGDGEFAVAVDNVLEVRPAAGVVPMASAGPNVVGLLPRANDTLTVITLLGSWSKHVLVLDVGSSRFGLLVEEVRGIVAVDEREIEPSPPGQTSDLVSGVLRTSGGGIVLLVDANALGRKVAA